MMSEKETQDLFKSVIKKWGEVAQFDMLLEETSELQIEIHKIKRGRNDGVEALAGEMADVYITMQQMEIIFKDQDLWGLIGQKIEFKLNRLKNRVES